MTNDESLFLLSFADYFFKVTNDESLLQSVVGTLTLCIQETLK